MHISFGILSLLLACNESVIEKQDNTAPTILIGSHSSGVEVLDGYIESFRASVSDDDNDYSELSVAWYVGEDIVCDWAEVSPAGESFCDIVFSSGDTNVIAEVRDSQGAGGRAEIDVVVTPTEAPVAQILNPAQNSNHYSDQLIQFSGIVSDNEDNPEDLIVTWSSSLDGDLILDTTPDTNGNISDYGYLSEGQHALELRVEDSSGKITKEQLVIQVDGANSIPTCELLSPAAQSSFQVGESILFEGTALDDNVSTSELSVTFNSDKDGLLGNATVDTTGVVIFTTNQLSNNIHVISLLVEDEVGANCQSSIVISVGTPPSVSIEEPLSGDVFSLGDDILFHGTFTDAEDVVTDLVVSWDSSTSGQIGNGNPDSQGSHLFSSNTLDAGVHTVTLSATDTTGLSGADTITFRVNTPPTAPMVSLSPDPVFSDDILTVTATGSTDDDGDAISYTYQWYEDGTLSSSTLSTVSASDLDVGEVWTVRVTPNDGFTDGAYAESSITISNSDPTVNAPTISSATGSIYNDSVVTCTATATDIDEVVTPSYTWDINGSSVTGSSVDLSNYTLSAGDTIFCTADVADSNGGSATSQSSVVIDNRAPSITTVSISPSNPSSQDLLTCSVTSSDADGDSLTESMEWFVAGSSVGITNTLDLAIVGSSPGDSIECVATVSDASASDQQSTTVTVVNTNPTIDVLTLSPTEPTLSDSLSCYAESTDIDGDTPSLSFSFTNQSTGSVYSPTTASTNIATLDISSTDADYDHILTCAVTASDADGGSVSDSANVTVVNTSPIFDQDATITPSTVEIGTNVECSAIASDPDDGVASLSYVWQVNGSQVAIGSTWTVSSTDASVGDALTCLAVAVDFEGNSSTSTSTPSTIANTVPEVSGVVLNSLSPYTNDSLSVSPTTYDFNGDAVTLNYEWHVIDASQSNQDIIVYSGAGTTFAALDGSQSYGFDKGDEVYVNVTPNDGVDNGVTVESDHAIVQNTGPSAPSVSVTSNANPPLEGVDDLTCTITSGSIDDDGDTLDYTYNWYDSNGTNVQILPNTNSLSDTFPGTNTTPGLWECEVVASDGNLTNSGTSDIEVDADWPGTLDFNSCGQTENTGPSQSLCDSSYSGTNLDGMVTVSSGIQTIVIPADGNYSITVAGAAGGASGGYGVEMKGTFSFSIGDSISVVVGQLGTGTSSNSGGGGGTFVWDSNQNSTPLIVAGGGGGEGALMNSGQQNAITSNSGHNGCDGSGWGPSYGGSGGSNGQGGAGGSGGNGGSPKTGGGGGWLSDGTGTANAPGQGAFGFLGGIGTYSGTSYGGFGGGGAPDSVASGGGGGYSGGGGGGWGSSSDYRGACGGGGGSYNAGTNQINGNNTNTGHGYVFIEKL